MLTQRQAKCPCYYSVSEEPFLWIRCAKWAQRCLINGRDHYYLPLGPVFDLTVQMLTEFPGLKSLFSSLLQQPVTAHPCRWL